MQSSFLLLILYYLLLLLFITALLILYHHNALISWLILVYTTCYSVCTFHQKTQVFQLYINILSLTSSNVVSPILLQLSFFWILIRDKLENLTICIPLHVSLNNCFGGWLYYFTSSSKFGVLVYNNKQITLLFSLIFPLFNLNNLLIFRF